MQETALDASAAVGWDAARYEALGQMWLIRETDIEYHQPLHWNDEVTVTTWVADFRRVQSRRMYEFHHAQTGALVAEASTNWVYLERETQMPVRIPDEVMRAYAPDGLPDAPRPQKFPVPQQYPEEIFRMQRHVEWRDIDSVGHVNNAAYCAYFEDVATQVARHYGWSVSRLQQENIAIILRRLRVQYLQPAFLDDTLEVACWLSNGKRASANRHYTLHRVEDGALLARGLGLWVCFDLEKMRPRRFPPEMLAAFSDNIVP